MMQFVDLHDNLHHRQLLIPTRSISNSNLWDFSLHRFVEERTLLRLLDDDNERKKKEKKIDKDSFRISSSLDMETKEGA